jgi:hypothetical protein
VAEDIFFLMKRKYVAKFEEKSCKSLVENEYNVEEEFESYYFFFIQSIFGDKFII